MKTRYLLLYVFLLLMVPGISQENSGRKQRDDRSGNKEQTEMLLNSKDFVFHARKALPSRGNAIDLTSNPNYVIFRPDMIESYMPFFGRAYSAPGYGNEAGLHFRGQPEEFNIEKTKRNYRITATVRGETDNFRLYLTVSPGGSASLSISSNSRETISYMGDISTPEKKAGKE